jgi:hypothetical protein
MAAPVLKSHTIYSFRYLMRNLLTINRSKICYYSTLEANQINNENQPIIIPKRIERFLFFD